MGVLEAAARIVELGGTGHRERTAALRAAFEAQTGAFAPDDPWFEERSRAFWSDALTRGRLGRDVEGELAPEEQRWLGPLERAHRGLFRRAEGARGVVLVDVWSGAELVVTELDDASRAELDAGADQLFDARVAGMDDPFVLALLPGAIFHPPPATQHIAAVLEAARSRGMTTHETLDALLRMERSLRALSRVKAAYAYRAEALATLPAPSPGGARPVRWTAKGRK